MDKSELIFFGWFGVAYIWMIITRNMFPPPIDQMTGSFGIFIMLGGIVFQSMYVKNKLSEFQHLLLIVEPPIEGEASEKRRGAEKRQFFFTVSESYLISGEGQPIRYMTILYAGIPFKHRLYGAVDRIFLYHNLPWLTRINLRKGTATYGATTVDIPQSDYVVCYEMGVPFQELGKSYPQYAVLVAGGDYPHLNDVIKENYVTSPKIQVGK